MSEECILSFGVMTDNHLDPAHPELAERTLASFRLLKELDPDLLIDCGDITDFWLPEELKHFQAMFRETFQEKSPKTLWLLAGHDVTRHPDYFGAYPEGAKYIEMEDTIPVRRVNGISFIGIFQCADYKIFEEKLQQEIARSQGKPVFVATHEPAYNTTLGSNYNGDEELRKIFEKYPQVIQISGHTHAPISHDRNIWQGEFTSFNSGSLTYWKDTTLGRESRRHQSYDTLFCQLYRNRLEIRRFNVMTRKELAPAWVVPLPFDSRPAPYAPERRQFEQPAAVFQTPDALRFTAEGPGILTIKHAHPHSSVQRYRATLFEEEKEIAVLDFYPGTWAGAERENEEDFYFPVGMLRSGSNYRCSVCALNHFDRAGNTVEFCFTAPEMGLQALPVKGIGPILAGEQVIPVTPEGEFEVDAKYLHGYRITLPEKLKAYYDRNVVMVLDISCTHAGRPAVIMACGVRPDYGRHFFPAGSEKTHRHCFDLTDLQGDFRYLLLCEGEAGKYRMNNIQYFTFPK